MSNTDCTTKPGVNPVHVKQHTPHNKTGGEPCTREATQTAQQNWGWTLYTWSNTDRTTKLGVNPVHVKQHRPHNKTGDEPCTREATQTAQQNCGWTLYTWSNTDRRRKLGVNPVHVNIVLLCKTTCMDLYTLVLVVGGFLIILLWYLVSWCVIVLCSWP